MKDGGDAARRAETARLAEEAAAPEDATLLPPEGEAADARFEDGARPARLIARDGDDLAVFSALLQDAALLVGDIGWSRPEKRFALVANRYRWEEPEALERVRVGVHFDGVLAARTRGLDLGTTSRPVALLSMSFDPAASSEAAPSAAAEPEADGETTPAPSGVVRLVLSGDAEIALTVDALDAVLQDLTRPWRAKRRPAHPDQ